MERHHPRRRRSFALSRAALEDLCRPYWPPLYAFLRRSGHTPHEAQDLVQGYLARLLEREDLATVSPDKGRFRSYLLAGLRNYLVSEARQAGTLKRGGRAEIISLDTEYAESLCQAAFADGATPDLAFDRRWAETILNQALEKLRQEKIARAKRNFTKHSSHAWHRCSGRLHFIGPGTVHDAGRDCRVHSPAPPAFARTGAGRRRRHRRSETDLEDEMRNLLAILSP